MSFINVNKVEIKNKNEAEKNMAGVVLFTASLLFDEVCKEDSNKETVKSHLAGLIGSIDYLKYFLGFRDKVEVDITKEEREEMDSILKYLSDLNKSKNEWFIKMSNKYHHQFVEPMNFQYDKDNHNLIAVKESK